MELRIVKTVCFTSSCSRNRAAVSLFSKNALQKEEIMDIGCLRLGNGLGLPDGEVETVNDRGVVGNLLLSCLKRLARLLLAPSYNESRSRNRVMVHYCISLFRVLQT